MKRRNGSRTKKTRPVRFGVDELNSKKRRPKMNCENTRTIETAISVDMVKDIISRYLADKGFVNKDECIATLDLQYNNLKDDPTGHAIVPLIYTLEKNVREEV
jgi:hypothetical protein